ncbi:MAG TPA: hypothetical protein VNB94_09065 [Mycobacteriales bacterium]|nr:hypothetical protein [Mycobacteriales bacterium]
MERQRTIYATPALHLTPGSLVLDGQVSPSPQQFYERVLAFADAERRLPLPAQSMWEIFPFEHETLRTKPLDPLVLPEPPRHGEDPSQCRVCARGDERAAWTDDRWMLVRFSEPLGLPFGAMLTPRAHLDLGDLDDEHAADLGLLTVRLDRAIRALGGIGRVHVNKWGDGGAHLHVMFLARPAGLLQLRGSNLSLWEEMLPRVPLDEAAEALHVVSQSLAAWRGRAH